MLSTWSENLSRISLPQNWVPIVNRVNTTVTLLDGGVHRIAKTGGVDGQFDASAISTVPLTGDFLLEVSLSTLNDSQLGSFGLSTDTTPGATDFTRLTYSVLLSSGVYFVYESGGNTAQFNDNGQKVFFRRVGERITYELGATAETAIEQRERYNAVTLYFDSSIQDTTARLDVKLTTG